MSAQEIQDWEVLLAQTQVVTITVVNRPKLQGPPVCGRQDCDACSGCYGAAD